MRSLGLILFALGIALLFASHAEGRTFFVYDTNDSARISSLRGAIIAANQIGGNNTIILGQLPGPYRNQQWIYRLTISSADENAALTGDLDITHDNLIIVGAVPNATIDATGLGDRVFQVLPGARLTLVNLVIRGGNAPAGSYNTDGEAGGAIYNAGNLFLEHCIITNNSSGAGSQSGEAGPGLGSGDGGGIYNSGTLAVYNCIVAENSSGAGGFGASGGNGGGIRNDGTCILADSIISGNQSGAGGIAFFVDLSTGGDGGNGGGIYNSGTIVLNNCVVNANASGQGSFGTIPSGYSLSSIGGPAGAGGNGAGVYNIGQMSLNFSSVYDNNSGNGGNGVLGGNAGTGGNGAGIFNAGKLSLNTSTISDNLCGNGGTGGYGDGYAGADGGVGGSGGAIYNIGLLDLSSCTIAMNQTGFGGNGGNSVDATSAAAGGSGGCGGGILNDANSTNVTVRNTLIALNSVNAGGAGGTNVDDSTQEETTGDAGSDGLDFDLAGDLTTQGFNLIGTGDGSIGFTNGINADQVGSVANPINPLLGPLQMNGGFTPTQALLPGSPAIDQGKCFGIHRDQRGDKRPYNNKNVLNAPGGDGSDIGAFELEVTWGSFPPS